jgi:hypothetical protein
MNLISHRVFSSVVLHLFLFNCLPRLNVWTSPFLSSLPTPTIKNILFLYTPNNGGCCDDNDDDFKSAVDGGLDGFSLVLLLSPTPSIVGGRWMLLLLLLLLLSSAVRLNFRLDDVDLKFIPFFMCSASCFNCTWIDGCSFRVFWQQPDDGDQLNIN